VVLRPTNLLIWIAILTLALTRMTLDGKTPLTRESLAILFSEIALCGTIVLAISAVIDHFYFGFWTFPPYKFLYFNLSQNLAVFYGSNDWHYYLSQGIPLLTTSLLPFAIMGLFRSASSGSVLQSNSLRALCFAVFATVGSLSVISHKEVRFIYPLLPILHVLAAPHVASFFTTPVPPPPSTVESHTLRHKLKRKPILVVLLLINFTLAGYLGSFHQPAPLNVLSFLRGEYERLHPDTIVEPFPSLEEGALSGSETPEGHSAEQELFGLFLTPCHSTPWRSHMVYPGLRARALTCEPPLDTAPGSPERLGYLDEADRFYAIETAADGGRSWGKGFLQREMWPLLEAGYPRGGEVPRYIVGFEGIEEMLLEFFDEQHGLGKDMAVTLTRVWEGWNGLFNEDWRRRGLLVVWDTGRHRNAATVD
jgi:GPI mannosyltransferase 3